MARYKAGEFSGESARVLRPRFFRSPSVAPLPDRTRILYLSILIQCDARGIAPGEPRNLRSFCWGFQDEQPSLEDVEVCLRELETCDARARNNDACKTHGAITRYERDGYQCIFVNGFAKWNRMMNKPSVSELPDPPPGMGRKRAAQTRIKQRSKDGQSAVKELSKDAQSVLTTLPSARDVDVDVEKEIETTTTSVPSTEEEEADPLAATVRDVLANLQRRTETETDVVVVDSFSSTATADGDDEPLPEELVERMVALKIGRKTAEKILADNERGFILPYLAWVERSVKRGWKGKHLPAPTLVAAIRDEWELPGPDDDGANWHPQGNRLKPIEQPPPPPESEEPFVDT